jgi:hypothetical protein
MLSHPGFKILTQSLHAFGHMHSPTLKIKALLSWKKKCVSNKLYALTKSRQVEPNESMHKNFASTCGLQK